MGYLLWFGVASILAWGCVVNAQDISGDGVDNAGKWVFFVLILC
jgi:hypothetical protein